MVDLGIDVIGTPGQHDAAPAGLPQILHGPVALGLDIQVNPVEFGIAGRHRRLRLGERDLPVGENPDQPLGQLLRIVQVHEGIDDADPVRPQPLDVLGQHLGIERDYRAVVVVVRLGELPALVVHARHEYGLDALGQ